MAFLCARLGGRRPSRLSLTHGLADSPALLDGHGYGVVWNVAFSPSAERLASVSQDGELLIWTTDPPALLQHIDVESTFLYALCWAHDSSAIAVGGGSAHIFVYAYAADTAVRSTTVRCSSIVQGLAFSHDSTLLAAASSEGSAWVWRARAAAAVTAACAALRKGRVAGRVAAGLPRQSGQLSARAWLPPARAAARSGRGHGRDFAAGPRRRDRRCAAVGRARGGRCAAGAGHTVRAAVLSIARSIGCDLGLRSAARAAHPAAHRLGVGSGTAAQRAAGCHDLQRAHLGVELGRRQAC
eukprot:TRINITY_DN382_c0_g1_i1.p1 TRINITY_DN382_c0_g1~~TRINITY_DN382_c0_g1_i1.p1  ORF type:complete len:319 (-),score=41.21 TRINITY_DN382_c0_g1_i1:252-1145(-)